MKSYGERATIHVPYSGDSLDAKNAVTALAVLESAKAVGFIGFIDDLHDQQVVLYHNDRTIFKNNLEALVGYVGRELDLEVVMCDVNGTLGVYSRGTDYL